MALTEIFHSRSEDDGTEFVECVRAYTCLKADITEGVGGWTVTGLPAKGDAYPTAWSPAEFTPRVYRRHINPRPPNLRGFCLITVYYRAPTAWVA